MQLNVHVIDESLENACSEKKQPAALQIQENKVLEAHADVKIVPDHSVVEECEDGKDVPALDCTSSTSVSNESTFLISE